MVEIVCSIITTSVAVLGFAYTVYQDKKDKK